MATTTNIEKYKQKQDQLNRETPARRIQQHVQTTPQEIDWNDTTHEITEYEYKQVQAWKKKQINNQKKQAQKGKKRI